MARSDIEEIGDTLGSLVTPHMKPRELLKAVRKKHPKASTKTIVRAAFYNLIAHSEQPADKARQIQDFALSERGEE